MIRSAVLVLALWAGAATASAQGCSQCREQVGQTPARQQQAYRKAIVTMVAAAAAVFIAGAFTIRKFR